MSGRGVGAAALAVASLMLLAGRANATTPEVAWPVGEPAAVADVAGSLGGNLSGLAPAGPSSLWAVRDAPGSLLALDRVDGRWTPRAGWGAGRALRYPDGRAGPDAEAVAVVAVDPAAVFVGAERDNAAGSGRRNAVLRYETAGTGPLRATTEWRLDDLAPSAGANSGLEGLAWIPDSALVAGSLSDRSGRPYVPAEHPPHHGGLFAVAFETSGEVHLVLLTEAGDVTPILTVAVDLPALMELHWDVEHRELWATCDDTCDGRTALLRPAGGSLEVVAVVGAPPGSASLNDEGLARLACQNAVSLVVRADDAATGGHALREAALPCRPLAEIVAAPSRLPAPSAPSAPSAAPLPLGDPGALAATSSPAGIGRSTPIVVIAVGGGGTLAAVTLTRRRRGRRRARGPSSSRR
jgi:hypothetical protein